MCKDESYGIIREQGEFMPVTPLSEEENKLVNNTNEDTTDKE